MHVPVGEFLVRGQGRTILHSDHVGWLAPEGTPAFKRARIVHGATDWRPLIHGLPHDDWSRVGLEAVRAAGSIEAIDGDGITLAPGITARHTPGHTLGHYVLDERLVLLGDVIHTPVQLRDDRVRFIGDHDPDEAARTRQRWLAEIAGTSTVIAAAHFPGMEFLRLGPDRAPWRFRTSPAAAGPRTGTRARGCGRRSSRGAPPRAPW